MAWTISESQRFRVRAIDLIVIIAIHPVKFALAVAMIFRSKVLSTGQVKYANQAHSA